MKSATDWTKECGLHADKIAQIQADALRRATPPTTAEKRAHIIEVATPSLRCWKAEHLLKLLHTCGDPYIDDIFERFFSLSWERKHGPLAKPEQAP